MDMSWMDELHGTLTRRVMPETVAQVILAVGPAWTHTVRMELARVASGRPLWAPASMPDDFERPADCAAQLRAAAAVLGVPADGIDPADPGQVRTFLAMSGRFTGGWTPGDGWDSRPSNAERERMFRATGLIALRSGRAYNRAVRALWNLDAKCTRMEHAYRVRRLLMTGRSALACDIPRDRFAADPLTACLVAYLTARKNRRRQFTLAGKENPVDRAAQAMLDAVLSHPEGRDLEMLAMAHPRAEIISRLTARQQGALMGRWWAVMRETAEEMRQAYPAGINQMSMIVRKGMDSYAWNTTAQAYNAARAAWLACAASSGAYELTASFLPGKAMRLMAADLAWWHRNVPGGGGVDPDTFTWARLPMPWAVLSGEQPCTRADVEAACAEAGIDPVATGWTAPRPQGLPAQYVPTPDLVHGVAVSDPAWALLLRRAGVFSGKRVREQVQVPLEVINGPLPVRTEDGAMLGTWKDGMLQPPEGV